MRSSTINAARGKWRSILPAFGIDAKYLDGRHHDCPLCLSGKDRFRFDNRGGTGSYFCNSCQAGYGIHLAMGVSGQDFVEVARKIDDMIGNIREIDNGERKSMDVEKIKNNLRQMIKQSKKYDTLTYLTNRGITSSPDVYCHRSLPYYEDGKLLGNYPAILGVLKNPQGQGVAIQRIYLDGKGNKANVSTPKKMTPTVGELTGCAVRLYPAGEVLGVAEGIETACAAHDLFDVPVWAAVNSNILKAFEPPEGVKKLFIYGDNDSNFTGQDAAYSLAKRLSAKGLDVEVKIPEIIGDFNDVLMRVKK